MMPLRNRGGDPRAGLGGVFPTLLIVSPLILIESTHYPLLARCQDSREDLDQQ